MSGHTGHGQGASGLSKSVDSATLNQCPRTDVIGNHANKSQPLAGKMSQV